MSLLKETDLSQFERSVGEKIVEVRTRHFVVKISEDLINITKCKQQHNFRKLFKQAFFFNDINYVYDLKLLKELQAQLPMKPDLVENLKGVNTLFGEEDNVMEGGSDLIRVEDDAMEVEEVDEMNTWVEV
ncbi:hypothetical protein RCL_jg24695.t1 [Rhizophagus clarus]|uniref:Uncharacterized protein n=1 Tax=Rhizophagus clarus TaxID=94130 RepID=A0A8H3M681_9GLOM|nr:hypothetical protein RCL_jg24695.t1 [Rhizophagus clarus]